MSDEKKRIREEETEEELLDEENFSEEEEEEEGSLSIFAFEWVNAFTIALISVVILLTFVFRQVTVSGTSMTDTLQPDPPRLKFLLLLRKLR